jgi:alcohol dehydrogenase (cytochrome c)
MILADMNVDGKPTKVLMDANRNGFFYVLDRSTGRLLAANPYVNVTWASRVDLETGRPARPRSRRERAPVRR